jgi:hypothetical protein
MRAPLAVFFHIIYFLPAYSLSPAKAFHVAKPFFLAVHSNKTNNPRSFVNTTLHLTDGNLTLVLYCDTNLVSVSGTMQIRAHDKSRKPMASSASEEALSRGDAKTIEETIEDDADACSPASLRASALGYIATAPEGTSIDRGLYAVDCLERGAERLAWYNDTRGLHQENITVGSAAGAGYDCMGRCGAGCDSGLPYTQACLNHDLCSLRNRADLGAEDPNCGDEWRTAVADYMTGRVMCRKPRLHLVHETVQDVRTVADTVHSVEDIIRHHRRHRQQEANASAVATKHKHLRKHGASNQSSETFTRKERRHKRKGE